MQNRAAVSKEQKLKEIAMFAITNYPRFIEVNRAICTEVMVPYEAASKQLLSSIQYVQRGENLLNDLCTAIINLNSMIQSQDKLSLLDKTFNSILDNELALAKKYFLDKEDELLPKLDFDGDRGGFKVMAVFKPVISANAEMKQAYEKVKAEISENIEMISQVEEMYLKMKHILSGHVQTVENCRASIKVSQSKIVALCDTAIEAKNKNVSTASTESNTPSHSGSREDSPSQNIAASLSNPKLSSLKQALHGNNSQAIQELRKKQREIVPPPQVNSCCIVM